MNLLQSFREMFDGLRQGGADLPAEAEMRLPRDVVLSIVREVNRDRPREVVTCDDKETPWLRVYESWGYIYIRTQEGR